MSVRDTVRNVMHAAVNILSLLFFAAKTKENQVHEIYLSTSKAMPLPLLANYEDESDEQQWTSF